MKSHLQRIYFYGLSFTIGFVSLATEIIIARALAPYWGSGTIVWSLVVGFVLVVLSIGYWYGGKVSDRYPDPEHLVLVIIPAALLFIPLSLLSPESLAVFFAAATFPLLLIGASSPWIFRIMNIDLDHSGELAGRLFALSTIGSFLGSVAAAFFLLPFIGTRGSFLILGAVLVLYISFYFKKVMVLIIPFLILFFYAGPLSDK